MTIEKYPAKDHISKVADILGTTEGIVFMSGGLLRERDDTDKEEPFRQESNFFYLTGVNEPGFNFIYILAERKSILFAPNLQPELVIWMGLPKTLEELAAQYDVDEVVYVSELPARLAELKPLIIHSFEGHGRDVLPPGAISYKGSMNYDRLQLALYERRVIKSAYEIEEMRKISHISSRAHIKLMQACKPGMSEHDLHALFRYETALETGGFEQSYMPICGCGPNAATLHYNRNQSEMHDGQLILIDAGAESATSLYASDITRTFPVNGRFSVDQRIIYNIVLAMQNASFAMIKAGVPWEDVHQKASRVGCQGLVDAGILVGDVDELCCENIPSVFFPHGLGHLIGLDVHDVGGYPPGMQRLSEGSLRYLRTRRIIQDGMAITVEPGIYFCDFIIDPVVNDPAKRKFFNVELLDRFRKVGGVRIEDVIVVTKNGFDNLTIVPREIDEIEQIMAGRSM